MSNLWWLDLCIGLTVVAIGVLSTHFHDHKTFKRHYTNVFPIESDSIYSMQFRIHQTLKPSAYHNKSMVELIAINNKIVCGKVLLNTSKDSIAFQPEIDAIYYTSAKFQPINKPLNPFQFDYSRYLERKYVYHQLVLNPKELLLVDSTKQTLSGIASIFRESVNKGLVKHDLKPETKSIINALLLGQRQDISEELYTSYAQAGAIHILAISGLHIGIILLLLNSFLRPLAYLKRGNIYKMFLIVLLLWTYALIAGMTASIVRAVSMFTVFAISMNLKRPTNTYNSLAISMFVILLIRPNFIFDVGFQLSYLAVLSIITIMPMLSNWWTPKNVILNFIWRTLSVTLAAQIGVFPLSLYYFNQFPGLFFVSNLVIIPFLGIILGVGLVIILLAAFDVLPEWIIQSYALIIDLLNTFINWVAQQESFLFQNVPFSLGHVFCCYMLIIAVLLYFKRQRFRELVFVLSTIILFQLFIHYYKYDQNQSELIIFHKSKYTIIAERHYTSLNVYHNISTPITEQTSVLDYQIGVGIKKMRTDSLKSIFDITGKQLLLVDSLGIYNTRSFKPEYVLLTGSPKLNLERLIDSLQPTLIIADGSNYYSYQERWKTTCEAKKIPFHQTSEKGALIISY